MFYQKNGSKELDTALFQNPTSEYRGTPFWAWNCKMDAKMLEEQIMVLKEMGFGGFHMHARTGIVTPYLGEEFMDLVRACVKKAKKEEMLAYLYDEDRWPSGFAGGYVTKNPKYRERRLVFSLEKPECFSFDVAEQEGKPYLLAVYDIVLNRKGELEKYRKIGEEDTPEGKKWYAYIETAKENPWFNNQTYVDTLNKEAIDESIKVTYAAYDKAIGEEFGKTVPSIFTDEPHFAGKCPLGVADSEERASFPWTMAFPKLFSDTYHYDITEKLPEIVWNLPGGAVSAARYHYHDRVTEQFVRCYADNCGKWCDEHGIALTGHVLEEEKLRSQTAVVGDAMRSYRSFAIPGIDMLCNFVELTTAKQCQSAVHQYGREAMLSELYGVTNWDFDFRGHKFQGDWQAALGVTVRVPHLSWVSMEGEAKRDYPASINYQSPWHKEYRYIEDHFARLNTALTRGKPRVKVGVVHPIESYWLDYGPAENTLAVREQADEKFQNIVSWLLFGTVDFDFVNEALLPSQVGDDGVKLKVGVMEYDVVVVPDCKTIRSTTLAILERFHQAGGSIIFAGECPKYVDAVASDAVRALYDRSKHVPYDKISILDALEDFREVRIKNANGAPTENLIYNMRTDATCNWLFVAHGKKESTTPEVTKGQKITVCVKGSYRPMVYDTLDGSIRTIPYVHKNGTTVIPYTMYQNDSLLLQLTRDENAAPGNREDVICEPENTLRVTGKVDYERTEPNVYMLDRAEYSIDGEPFRPEEEILRLDNICRKRMGWPLRGESFAQPWVVEEEAVHNELALRFAIYSEIPVTGAKLALERAEEIGITLNGEAVPSMPDGWYTDHIIRTVPLPPLRAGKNELVVRLPFGKRTNTEWCYILGDFGVKVEGRIATIIDAPKQIGFSDLATQGMPFYGGNLIYRTEIETPDCTAVIRANYYRAALLKVFVDGEEKGVIAFSPYRLKIPNLKKGKHEIAIEAFGTRINTFGGVHNVLQFQWVGPNFWRTNDDAWCYEYCLKETGILASPIFEIYPDDTSK